MGHLIGLYPGHLVDFNFEKEGEQGESGRRQLVVGELLSRTYGDAVYTAMIWDIDQTTPVYGLVRAPTVISPAQWGSGICADPKLGVIRSDETLDKVMPRPQVMAPIRILLPLDHPAAFGQCYNHVTFPGPRIRSLDKESFLPERLFPTKLGLPVSVDFVTPFARITNTLK